MFQILVHQINAHLLDQCQENAQTSVLVIAMNSRRCYLLGKVNFSLY